MKQRNIFLIDGATGSELERRGVDTSMPLWSARAIIDAPEILKQIQAEYLNAGAQAITANTFRTHERSLAKAGMGDRAKELTRKAVEIARSACDENNSDAIVYGCVAPLEDCYSPELTPDIAICKEEHSQIIQHLVESGADLVLIETMCSEKEVIAAAEAAEKHAKDKWAISFCLSNDETGILLDGTPISDLVTAVEGAQFVGINCFPATTLETEVKHLRNLLPADMEIAAFGNVGYANKEIGWINTDAVEPNKYASYAMSWIDAGATIVGGCCGTTPQTIRAIHTSLENRGICLG